MERSGRYGIGMLQGGDRVSNSEGDERRADDGLVWLADGCSEGVDVCCTEESKCADALLASRAWQKNGWKYRLL
jgi:hypothetical protein